MEEVNALLARLHRLECAVSVTTRCFNGDPDDFEWRVSWTRLLRLPNYSRGLSEQSVTAPTLPEALRRLLDTEAKFDRDEAVRLSKKEKADE